VLGTLLLATGSLVVVLLLLEVAVRIAVPHWPWLVPQRFMTMTPDGVLGGVPNFDGRVASLFGDFDVALQFDARGFRNPPGADPAAPLAFVGDSFCQGWGVEYAQGFAPRVADVLGVPAYNFCTVGADLSDDLRVLETWMPPRRDGATVLTVTFENDVLAYPDAPAAGAASASVQGLSRGRVSRWLMQHSALFDVGTTLARQNATIVAAVRRLGLVSGVPVVGEGTDPIAASVRMVGRIRRAAGDGPFLVVVVPPRPGQVAFNDVDAFVTALRAAGFDVLDPREQPGLTITTIPHDGHWDAAMHAAVAPLIAERLRALSPAEKGPLSPL
jgi:hypothetical protein